eukprot:1094970-Prymnesium_polylepis.1
MGDLHGRGHMGDLRAIPSPHMCPPLRQAQRGRTQTTAYLVRTVGNICAGLLVGLCMNGPEYQGSFDSGLSFSVLCAIVAVPSALMVPVSFVLVKEDSLTPRATPIKGVDEGGGGGGGGGDDEVMSASVYFGTARQLFESYAMLE